MVRWWLVAVFVNGVNEEGILSSSAELWLCFVNVARSSAGSVFSA